MRFCHIKVTLSKLFANCMLRPFRRGKVESDYVEPVEPELKLVESEPARPQTEFVEPESIQSEPTETVGPTKPISDIVNLIEPGLQKKTPVGVYTLPIELILVIVSFLPVCDIRSLRQTCKLANNLLQGPHNAARFCIRRHAVVEPSVIQLRRFTKHIDVRHCLRVLHIGLEYPKYASELYKLWEVWYDKPGLEQFTQAIRCLPRLKEVEIYNNLGDDGYEKPLGLGRRLSSLNLSNYQKALSIVPSKDIYVENVYQDVVLAIFEATMKNSFQLAKLTIPQYHLGEMGLSPRWLKKILESDDERETQNSLKKLHLQVQGTGASSKDETFCPDWTSYLKRFILAHGRKVEEMHLYFVKLEVGIAGSPSGKRVDSSANFYFPPLCSLDIRLSHLKNLRLESLECEFENLRDFIQNHRYSLQKLHLQNMSVHIGEWWDILRMIATDLELEYLHLESVKEYPRFAHRFPTKTVFPSRASWNGKSREIKVFYPKEIDERKDAFVLGEILEVFQTGLQD